MELLPDPLLFLPDEADLYPVDDDQARVAIGDFNNDGIPDVAAADNTGGFSSA